MRFLIDMNLTTRWVPTLVAAGHEASRTARPSIIRLRGEPLTPELRAGLLICAFADCSTEVDYGAILTH